MMVVVGGDGGSDIIPAKTTNIPQYSLIKSGKYRNDLLVDIGAVHEIAPPKMTIWSKKFPTTFSLADAEYEGDFDPREYPVLLDDMMGTELTFKVKMQSNGKLASVLNYRADPEIKQSLWWRH
ncbi:hypothetical protein A2U01_0010624 [Trifolium medium]|uniref:Uncharacterized protein n=1 Tax=Trifolium medium TaxID=97028 RepID=A0A392MR06_9FABA|nr:hypothetical protein [Trifolium medium]